MTDLGRIETNISVRSLPIHPAKIAPPERYQFTLNLAFVARMQIVKVIKPVIMGEQTFVSAVSLIFDNFLRGHFGNGHNLDISDPASITDPPGNRTAWQRDLATKLADNQFLPCQVRFLPKKLLHVIIVRAARIVFVT